MFYMPFEPYAQESDEFRQVPACPGGQIYTIRSGDTIYSLAQRFQVSVTEILNANPGLNPNAMQIGQRICIPGRPSIPCPNGFIYVIRPGDTLASVANRNNIPLQELIAANPQLPNPGQVTVGTNICVPRRPAPQVRFQCVVLQPTTVGGNAEGVALLNYSTNSILLSAAALPPLTQIGGERYVGFARRRGTNAWTRIDLVLGAGGIWSGRAVAGTPLNAHDLIVVSAETGPGLASPGTVVLQGTFTPGQGR